jgi:hypothetical protein
MSAPSRSPFNAETIAQVAATILLQPISLCTGLSYHDACVKAFNLLVAANRVVLERAAAVETRSGN